MNQQTLQGHHQKTDKDDNINDMNIYEIFGIPRRNRVKVTAILFFALGFMAYNLISALIGMFYLLY